MLLVNIKQGRGAFRNLLPLGKHILELLVSKVFYANEDLHYNSFSQVALCKDSEERTCEENVSIEKLAQKCLDKQMQWRLRHI